MDVFSYRNLRVYQGALQLVTSIYNILKSFPVEERYGLSDQLRRASVSVPSNLAEGSSRFSRKEQIHYIELSYGSLLEVMCQIEISHNLGYVNDDNFNAIESDVMVLAKQLSGLRTSMQSSI
ncbi:MAG: four helix bundle protein [Prevotella sp.]|jgi:four helix bundle protein|nr:four helix bundle protein [Prevotella sp.]MBR4600928.1 four helix bundle protein [Prevotella sp.]MBR6139450.1 four helix bundle protein [Prevotella sp.]